MVAGYYAIKSEDFQKLSKSKFKIVRTLEDLYVEFANDLANLIEINNKEGRQMSVILPVGPFDYRIVARFFNEKRINCKNLTIFMMDEYCTEEGDIIPYEHPLGFRRFMDENFFSLLMENLAIPRENIIFPDPKKPEYVTDNIERLGGVDVCYAGFGINGHIAFNEPLERGGEGMDEKSVINSITRIVNLSRETRASIAIGSTCGNWDLIPPKAVTIGIKDILLSKQIRLYFMRAWHHGVMRRALFGPIDPSFPASYVQTHPNVTVTMTSYVAEPPLINVTQAIGR